MSLTLSDIELNRIQHLKVGQHQVIVEHKIPGSDGNAFQNLGRKPVTIEVEGVLQNQEGIEILQQLREKLNAHQVLTFASEAATPSEIDQVIIDSLTVNEIAGKPLFFQYKMILKEVVERPAGFPDTQALADINSEILGEADDFLENLEDGLDSLQKAAAVKTVVDKLSPQITRLGELVKKLQGGS